MGTDRYGSNGKTGAPLADSASREAPDARIGTVIANRYNVVRLLGRGGMGNVYEARDVILNRRWAVKFLLPQFAGRREILRRFENEAKAAGGLEHPNLVAVTDFGYINGAPYIVMEFLQGEDCSKLLHRAGALPVPRAADIVRQACRGLAVAHKHGIVHRDLKPENLFLTDAGDGTDLVKVLDFGIAKLRTPDVSLGTRTGETLGTAYYMSPEQARGARDVDERTDVWSLGVVLYELLVGQRPFDGETFLQVIHQILSVDPPRLGTLRPSLPRDLIAIVEGAMTKDFSNRLPTVATLAGLLAQFAGRSSLAPAVLATAPPLTAPTPPTRVPVSLSEPIELVPRAVGRAPNLFAQIAADSSAPTAGSESVAPWGGTSPGSTKSRRRVATVAVLAVAVAGTAAALLQRAMGRGADQDPVAASVQVSAARAVEVPKPMRTSEVRGLDPTTLPEEPSALASSEQVPAAKMPPVQRVQPPQRTTKPATPPQQVNCDPPYTVLPSGQHKPKPECL